MGYVIFVLFTGLGLYLFLHCVRIVPQSEAYVVERLGKYNRTMESGVNILLPFVEHITNKVDLREKAYDFEPQSVITEDNVTMDIDTVVYMSIVDPYAFTYKVHSAIYATENFTATTLRNIIGGMSLDETLTSREAINQRMRAEVDAATDPWGIKVIRIEVKNITPPRDIQNSMEKQMQAEREKRVKILHAEGEKTAMVKIAEGEREALLMRAQSQKEAKILAAQAEAQAAKELYDAQVFGIKTIKEAGADEAYLRLQSLKALEKMSDGQATKIFIPQSMENLLGPMTLFNETKKD